MINYRTLPKLRDSLTYHYIEHAILDKNLDGLEIIQKEGITYLPATNLSLLLLGPGTSITHAAITTLVASGCTIQWTGQDATKFYANGQGETRKAQRLLHQANLIANPTHHKQIVIAMYRYRFQQELPTTLTLAQIRGHEGVRVRQAYAEASQKYDVPWAGRNYDVADWADGDPINRALSMANGLLNGLCHNAIIAGGYSPALGFIHTGYQTAFVHDIADLYKVQLTIPLAFALVAESDQEIESRIRLACRQKFKEYKLLQKILPDIDTLLQLPASPPETDDPDEGQTIHPTYWDDPEEPTPAEEV